MIKKIENVLFAIEKRLIQVLFFSMTLVVLAAIFNRLTFNRQMAWSDEFSRYSFIWMTFIAAAYAVGKKAHIGVTAVLDRLPLKANHGMQLVLYILGLAFSVIIFWYTIQIMKTQVAYGQLSPSMRLPMQYAYLGMAVGSGFMILHFILQILSNVTERPQDQPAKEE